MTIIQKGMRLIKDTIVKYRDRRHYLRKPADYWVSLPTAVITDCRPVFILSTGRCGTLLLTRLFQCVPGVLCYHNPYPELVYVGRKAYEEGTESFESYKTAFFAARFELMADSVIRNKRFIETNHHVTFFAPHIQALFNNALYVHLVRHPGDFIRSGILRQYYQGQYSDIGRIHPLDEATKGAWDDMAPYEQCAWLWNETNRYIEVFKESCVAEQIITVKAEDLFEKPETVAAILRHCRLPPIKRDIVKSILCRPLNVQADKGTVLHYSKWSDQRKDQVRRWTPIRSLYGYSL